MQFHAINIWVNQEEKKLFKSYKSNFLWIKISTLLVEELPASHNSLHDSWLGNLKKEISITNKDKHITYWTTWWLITFVYSGLDVTSYKILAVSILLFVTLAIAQCTMPSLYTTVSRPSAKFRGTVIDLLDQLQSTIMHTQATYIIHKHQSNALIYSTNSTRQNQIQNNRLHSWKRGFNLASVPQIL